MATHTLLEPSEQLTRELGYPKKAIATVLQLLSEGNTVPFIARYRKEATGGLDEVQIRNIEERHGYLLQLEERRSSILDSIESQGKLTDALRAKIVQCTTKTELEDLYLPYKKKRRTRGTVAKERGLTPLAERIYRQEMHGDPTRDARAFVDPKRDVPNCEEALAGARDIVAEWIAEDSNTRTRVRQVFNREGKVVAAAKSKQITQERTKFEQYYDFSESVQSIPSHRYLAIARGEKEKVLRCQLEVDSERLLAQVQGLAGVTLRSPFAEQLALAAADSYKRLLCTSVQTEIRGDLKMRADIAAIEVFADNLRNLILAAPLGSKAVIGIDPGLRTGSKCVALDQTGMYCETATIFLHKGAHAQTKAKGDLSRLIQKHRPAAIAVGNGTGGRETEAFVRKLLKEDPALQAPPYREIFVVQVSESGASIYSASDIAREEFPDLDLTIRGAISIGRRLQDPLAELVKMDPKAIGVGQYQHDVHQPLLQKKLTDVIESSVNHVGVTLNTASAPLLSYVAGIGLSSAKKIVAHRDVNGPFQSRKQLLKVPGIGPKAFQQAAGFLRIPGAKNPLDASAVHPERYALVEKMARDLKVSMGELIGNMALISQINTQGYLSEDVGALTLADILSELQKPGRDPRSVFEAPRFRDDVNTPEDLQPGMKLEGVVTNVTAFGAFIDIGVHQDGLVHISQLADTFVSDPKDVVTVGQKLSVRVLEVDLQRRRIALSAKREVAPSHPTPPSRQPPAKGRGVPKSSKKTTGSQPNKPRPPREAAPAAFSHNPFAGLAKK